MRTLTALLLSAVSVLLPLKISADTTTLLKDILGLGLPVVVINTVDREEPTADLVTHPEGSMGEGITNATKVPGSVIVFGPDSTVMFDSGEYVKKESGMTVKIRGNTSAYYDKKPYKIKLQKKGDMLGRGDKKYDDKNWVLIKSFHLKNWIGIKIGEFLEHPWMPAVMFVNVIFNDDYRGLYLLQESVERNEKCRINVAEDGFVMEHDPYWWNEDGAYLESAQHPRYNFTFKYPDYEDADEETISAIHEALRLYDKSIEEGTYPDVIDVESFANWVLGHDILGTGDGGGVNWYITKKSLSDDSPLQCGPMWDFDSSEQKIDEFSRIHEGRFGKFFYNANKTFTQAYIERWEEIRDSVIQKTDSLIESLKDPEWAAYDNSALRDIRRWNIHEATSGETYRRVRKYYDDRFIWLDNAIARLKDTYTGTEANNIMSMGIRIEGKMLSVRTDFESVTVSGIDGRVFFSGRLDSGETITLPPGCWIIRAGSESRKVLI